MTAPDAQAQVARIAERCSVPGASARGVLAGLDAALEALQRT
jgi:hypothetical protein